MFEKLKKLKALSGAERALEVRGKIAKAIKTEETKLLRLIGERVEADHALIESETTTALGEEADVAGARKRADTIMVAISRQSATLGGLRARMAGQASELESQVRAITAALPEHINELKADFTVEWKKGAAAFGALLGRRAALVALIGKFDLPEPQPVAVELGDASAPWGAITALRAGLEEVAGWGRAAFAPAVDALSGVTRPFDAAGVYILMKDCDHLRAGTLVMQSVLVPGMLAHLFHIGYAESLTSQAWQTGLEAGATAARELEAESQAALRAAAAGQNAPPMTPAELLAAREAAQFNKNQLNPHPEVVGTVVI